MLKTVTFETISIKMKTLKKKFQNMQPGPKERVALRTLFSSHQIRLPISLEQSSLDCSVIPGKSYSNNGLKNTMLADVNFFFLRKI